MHRKGQAACHWHWLFLSIWFAKKFHIQIPQIHFLRTVVTTALPVRKQRTSFIRIYITYTPLCPINQEINLSVLIIFLNGGNLFLSIPTEPSLTGFNKSMQKTNREIFQPMNAMR